MYKRCWILLHAIFYIEVIGFALSQQESRDKGVNLALETVFEFDRDGKSDIQLLNNVQKFIGKVKNVLERKHIERRQTGTDQRNVLTNFILNMVNVLNKFEDDDLERFFGIINHELQRYCDKDDDKHILNKLGLVRNMPAYVLRHYLKAVTNKIEEEAYFEDEKAVIDGVNYLFKQDDTTQFNQFIKNLEEYRRKSRRNIDLMQVIKTALQNMFLDTFYQIKPTAKTVLRTIIHSYFGSLRLLATTKYPALLQRNSVKRAKSKTTREFRTWRQMYVEKNLDLKYPNDYVPVTEQHKRKDETRTQKSRLLPTTRAIKESRHRKGTKHGKVIEYDINIEASKNTDNSGDGFNSDDETAIIKTTKTANENDYKIGFYKRNSKQSNQFKFKSKDYDEDEDKYKAEPKNINKLSTFYLDLEKPSATSSVQQRFDTPRTYKYERPVARPMGFTFGIKYGKQWNSHQKAKKSKHYGYVQKKKIDVFLNERQMRMMKNKNPEMARMPPISLNMQLAMTKEPSTSGNGFRDLTLGVKNIYNPRSEEGLSIEGFQDTKSIVKNRRRDNHNDTVNNHVLNLIHKLEQDLEAVKTKIHNVSVIRNKIYLDNITKVTKNTKEVINVRKFYEERDTYDAENKESDINSPDKKVSLKNKGINNKVERNYMTARKTINDEKLYPVVRAREGASGKIIIQRKYEPLEKTLPNQNEHDFEENFNLINNILLSNESPTKYKVTYESLINEGNSITTTNVLIKNTKNIKFENTTIIKVLPSRKVFENGTYINNDSKKNTLQFNLDVKTFDHNKSAINETINDDESLPNVYKTANNGSIKENTSEHNVIIQPNKIKDWPKFRSQKDEINNKEKVTFKELTSRNREIHKSVINYKNTTDYSVPVNDFVTKQKVIDNAANKDKLTKPGIKSIERHIGINNNNVTVVPKLYNLKEITATDSSTIDDVTKSLSEKTS